MFGRKKKRDAGIDRLKSARHQRSVRGSQPYADDNVYVPPTAYDGTYYPSTSYDSGSSSSYDSGSSGGDSGGGGGGCD